MMRNLYDFLFGGSLAGAVRPGSHMTAVSHIGFRLATMLFAILMGVQSIWLSLPELLRPHITWSPTEEVSAADTAQHHGAAAWAASIGTIRGDVWAESAFTYQDLLQGNAPPNAEPTQALQHVRASLDHALKDAPHQSNAWLLLAALEQRYPSGHFNVTEALRMSYYTGPSEQDLMPIRLRLTAQLDLFSDVEMRQFATRDLRLLVARKRLSATAKAYNLASPAGKLFIEQTVRDFNSSCVESRRSGKSVRN
jgi:hypothetical protein